MACGSSKCCKTPRTWRPTWSSASRRSRRSISRPVGVTRMCSPWRASSMTNETSGQPSRADHSKPARADRRDQERENDMAIETPSRTETGGRLGYTDLRDWLKHVDAMGQLKYVNGANADEDIGQATDVLHHTAGSPAVMFDNIPGYDAGYRVLVNPFNTHPRIAFSVGVPHDVPT